MATTIPPTETHSHFVGLNILQEKHQVLEASISRANRAPESQTTAVIESHCCPKYIMESAQSNEFLDDDPAEFNNVISADILDTGEISPICSGDLSNSQKLLQDSPVSYNEGSCSLLSQAAQSPDACYVAPDGLISYNNSMRTLSEYSVLFDQVSSQPICLFTLVEKSHELIKLAATYDSVVLAPVNEFMKALKESWGIKNDVSIIFEGLENLVLHEDTDIANDNTLDSFFCLYKALSPQSDCPFCLTLQEHSSSAKKLLGELIARAQMSLEWGETDEEYVVEGFDGDINDNEDNDHGHVEESSCVVSNHINEESLTKPIILQNCSDSPVLRSNCSIVDIILNEEKSCCHEHEILPEEGYKVTESNKTYILDDLRTKNLKISKGNFVDKFNHELFSENFDELKSNSQECDQFGNLFGINQSRKVVLDAYSSLDADIINLGKNFHSYEDENHEYPSNAVNCGGLEEVQANFGEIILPLSVKNENGLTGAENDKKKTYTSIKDNRNEHEFLYTTDLECTSRLLEQNDEFCLSFRRKRNQDEATGNEYQVHDVSDIFYSNIKSKKPRSFELETNL